MRRALLVSLCLLAACGGGGASRVRSGTAPPGPPASFSFVALDGSPVEARRLRDRVTVFLFFTSYDVASQMAARVADEVRHTHRPRINVVGVAMEAPKYAVLVRAFGEGMGLGYPLVMADRATLAGEGPFGPLAGVPTWVVLDPGGRVAFRRAGPLRPEQLRTVLSEVLPPGAEVDRDVDGGRASRGEER